MVSLLLEAYKEGAKVAKKTGCLAAHVAARFSTLRVLLLVLNANRDALTQPAGEFGSILHQAASGAHADSVAVVEFLHEQDKSLIKTRDSRGFTPLHCAALRSSSEVIKCVYNLDRGAIQVANKKHDHLPLHSLMLRCELLPSCTFEPASDEAESLRFLLKACPMAVTVRNKEGLTPFGLCMKYAQRVSDYAKRLLLFECPSLSPSLFAKLNYEARYVAVFLQAFRKDIVYEGNTNLLRRLRQMRRRGGMDVVRHVISYL